MTWLFGFLFSGLPLCAFLLFSWVQSPVRWLHPQCHWAVTWLKDVVAFKFPRALTFYWQCWLQQHIMLVFLFLKSNLSFWPCLQSFLFPSGVPDTKTRKLGVILVFSTPTLPAHFQDSLDSFLMWSLKTVLLFFHVSLQGFMGLGHGDRSITGAPRTVLFQLSIVTLRARWAFWHISIILNMFSSPQLSTPSHCLETCSLVLPTNCSRIQTLFLFFIGCYNHTKVSSL